MLRLCAGGVLMATAAADGFIKFWTGRVTIILISASLESMLRSLYLY